MAETNLAFSKVVATPTPTAWSQAYSAGRLFAALSLQSNIIPDTGEEHLNALGKDLISTLESEFFTIENKDIESIRQAVTATISRVKDGINISFIVCYLNDNVLYLFATGGSKAVLKRGEKIGTVIQGEDSSEIKSASGYVREEDIIVLQTKPFQRIISPSVLASSLDSNNPEEIAEALAPHVHDKAEGGASSVILIYKKGVIQDIAPILNEETNGKTDEEKDIETQPEQEAISSETIPAANLDEKEEIPQSLPSTNIEDVSVPELTEPISNIGLDEEKTSGTTKLPSESGFASPFLENQIPKKKRTPINLNLGFLKKIPGSLSHSRKIILMIAIILVVLIAGTSFLALKNKQSSSNKALFTKTYEEAKTKYDEGENLKDLNTSLAQESFKEAKKILDENKDKFKTGSNEETQISELLDKVNVEISTSSNGENASTEEVDKSESEILSYELNNSSASYFTQNTDKAFFLDGTGVSQIDKGTDKKSQVIKKSWGKDGGIGLFGANIYVLDKSDGIIKFVPSGDSYSDSKYFSGDTPDFSNAQAMAIDGSVFILFKDGTIDKYTKAKKDTFSISGLEKPLSSPTRIFTNEDTDNVYILDNANSRVVVLDKTGKFISAYSAPILKNARDIDIKESSKKIYILSSGKVYQINIK